MPDATVMLSSLMRLAVFLASHGRLGCAPGVEATLAAAT
jgi:hypothetical protein